MVTSPLPTEQLWLGGSCSEEEHPDVLGGNRTLRKTVTQLNDLKSRMFDSRFSRRLV